MSVSSRASRLLNISLTLLFLPGQLVEEGLHAMGSMPWAERIRIEVLPAAGRARTEVQFRESTPGWAIRLAHLLPELVATLAGVAVLGWWLLGNSVWWPRTTLDWLLLSLFGAQWLGIAIPSQADIDPSEVRDA